MEKLSIKLRIVITALFIIAISGVLLWEYTHGGVVKHYILHSDDMPGMSNWWGLIIIPLFTWIVSSFIRIDTTNNISTEHRNILIRGLILFIIGCTISYIFTIYPESNFPLYITGTLVFISFFTPIHKAEYLLGYVLGTFFVFGTFIPVIAGCFLWILFYIFYKTPRIIKTFITSKQ